MHHWKALLNTLRLGVGHLQPCQLVAPRKPPPPVARGQEQALVVRVLRSKDGSGACHQPADRQVPPARAQPLDVGNKLALHGGVTRRAGASRECSLCERLAHVVRRRAIDGLIAFTPLRKQAFRDAKALRHGFRRRAALHLLSAHVKDVCLFPKCVREPLLQAAVALAPVLALRLTALLLCRGHTRGAVVAAVITTVIALVIASLAPLHRGERCSHAVLAVALVYRQRVVEVRVEGASRRRLAVETAHVERHWQNSRENPLDDHLACEPSKRHDALAANRGRRELSRALRRPQRRLACSRRLICGLRRRRRRRGCRRSRRQRAVRRCRPRRGRQRRRGRGRGRRRRRRRQWRSGTAWLHASGSGAQQPRSRLGPKLRHLHSNVVCAQQLRRHQAFELAHARFQLFAAAKRPRRLVLHGAAAQTV